MCFLPGEVHRDWLLHGNDQEHTDKSLLMEAFLAHTAAQKTQAPSPERTMDVGGRGDADRIIGSRASGNMSHSYAPPTHMVPPIRVMTQPPSAPPPPHYLPPHAWPPPPSALHDAAHYQLAPDLYQLSPAARMHFRPIAPAHYRRLAANSPLRQGYAKHSPRSDRAPSASSSRERHTSERSSDSRHSSGTGCSEKNSQSGNALSLFRVLLYRLSNSYSIDNF